MIRLVLIAPDFEKVSVPDGTYALVFTDPKTGIELVIPVNDDGIKALQGALSGVTVASTLPRPA